MPDSVLPRPRDPRRPHGFTQLAKPCGRNALLILNPSTGAAIPYPCSFSVLDFEGPVFMPKSLDAWGQISVNAHD